MSDEPVKAPDEDERAAPKRPLPYEPGIAARPMSGCGIVLVVCLIVLYAGIVIWVMTR